MDSESTTNLNFVSLSLKKQTINHQKPPFICSGNPLNEGFYVLHTHCFSQKLQLTPCPDSSLKQSHAAQFPILISQSTIAAQISNMEIVIFEITDRVVMLARIVNQRRPSQQGRVARNRGKLPLSLTNFLCN